MSAQERAQASLYHWILGNGYWEAASAFRLARNIHSGKRKGGDPEFSHQIWICNHIRTLPIPTKHMERAIIIGLLHDTIEDYPEQRKNIKHNVSKQAAKDSRIMSKIQDGIKMDNVAYMHAILSNPLTAIAKGVDRAHNLYTMGDGFSIEKQRKQIAETREYHIPMLKAARQRYPKYHQCFEALKMIITMQIAFLETLHLHMESTTPAAK